MLEQQTKICLVCDFLMTRTSTQRHHLRWFSTLLESCLEIALNADIDIFLSDENQGFSRNLFFKKSNIECLEDDVHFYFDENEITVESLDYLKKYIDVDTVVIGYELSESTRHLLTKAGITYIDVWLHPIRFMDDNFYAYRSNNAEINHQLSIFHMDENIYKLYANRLKIQSYMGWNKFKKKLDDEIIPNSCLFVGQTLTDKAICHEGKMLNILDYKEKFVDLTNTYSHVYFSRHPMLKEGGDEEQISFLNNLKNVSIITTPGYQLLCCENIKKVVAISSSLVYEASFFGKETDYFYKPVITVYNDDNNGYFSIFGQLHKPTFWAEVLKNSCKVKQNIPIVDFLGANNNYRDMLALYYNNHVFDKNHAMFAGEQPVKIALNSSIQKTANQNYSLNQLSFDTIKEQLKTVETVSFDIFDTLLQRSISKPGDIIRIVGEYAEQQYKIPKENFIKERINAKKYSASKEETLLNERYRIIGERLELTADTYHDLYAYELYLEKLFLHPKEIGKKLVQEAYNYGKRVILTSDTFFPKSFIEEILNREDIAYNALYLSSDHDQTKATGSLFETLITEEGTSILHIGDNHHSDYLMAKKHGIDAIHLPSNHNHVLKAIPSYKDLDGGYAAIRNGLIKNKLAHFPAVTREPGFSCGEVKTFGYTVIGDIFLTFAAWIIEKAVADKIDTLYFLARDGDIIKKSVDCLLRIKGAPQIKTKYFLASRRSLRVCALKDKNDVIKEIDIFIEELKKNRFPTTLETYLSHRFGLSHAEISILKLDGYAVKNIQAGKQINKLEKILKSEKALDIILKNGIRERELYLEYCKQEGLISKNKIAFVDIGHQGSLQASLVKLLDLEESSGYYFATYKIIDDVLSTLSGQHQATGFHLDRYDNKLSANCDSVDYIKFALIIESIFLNKDGSFLHFKRDQSKELTPVFTETDNEQARANFSENLHRGVTEYLDDFVKIINAMDINFNWEIICQYSGYCNRLYDILKTPSHRDARIFSGVTIENYFSGKDIRYLVPPKNALDNHNNITAAIWSQGTNILISKNIKNGKQFKKDISQLPLSKKMHFTIEKIALSVILGTHSRKYKKYEGNPSLYFIDSKNNLVRWYGRIAHNS